MLSLWLENQVVSVQYDVQIPEPKNGDGLIRVIRAGICATDLELVRGYSM
jgi:threonine dehydrogenase-like Zn-dependent dehydrogenase